ncbi:MAG: hypothetical protein WC489_06675 [Patescibacteria group bacterium]
MAKPIIKSHKNQTIFAVGVIVLFALFSIFLAYSVNKQNLSSNSRASGVNCSDMCRKKCRETYSSNDCDNPMSGTPYQERKQCEADCNNNNGGGIDCMQECLQTHNCGSNRSCVDACNGWCNGNPTPSVRPRTPTTPPGSPTTRPGLPTNPPPMASITPGLPQCPYTNYSACRQECGSCTSSGCASGTFKCSGGGGIQPTPVPDPGQDRCFITPFGVKICI